MHPFLVPCLQKAGVCQSAPSHLNKDYANESEANRDKALEHMATWDATQVSGCGRSFNDMRWALSAGRGVGMVAGLAVAIEGKAILSGCRQTCGASACMASAQVVKAQTHSNVLKL